MDASSGFSADEAEKKKEENKTEKARQYRKKYRERKKMELAHGSEDELIQVQDRKKKQQDRVNSKAYRDRKKQQNESQHPSDSESSTSRKRRLGRRRKRKQRRVQLNMDERIAPLDGPIRDTPDKRKRILEFRNQIMNFAVSFCLLCKEKWPDMKMKGDVCARCSRDKHEIKKFSKDNYMDPGIQPEELKGLSMIEMLLVAQACCVLKVWRLPSGQLKFRGHSIVFPQDITDFVSVLPRLPSELSIIIVRRKFNDGQCDFRIRREKVRIAVEWLIKFNPYYQNIEINETRLNCLPVDEIVLDGYKIVEEIEDENTDFMETDENVIIEEEQEEESFIDLQQDNSNPIHSGMMPEVVVQHSEIISETLNNVKDKNVIPWPPQSADPLSEFKYNGLLSRCFPTLFPHGNCELNTLRPIDVTLNEFTTHLMKYEDGRFANHHTFKYYMLNRIMRAEALSKGGLYYNKPENKVPATVKKLKEEIAKGNLDNLVENIVFFGHSTRGSKSYWFQQRKNLIAMIEQIKNPTYFITLSAADRLWPEIDLLIQKMYNQPPSKGLNNINEFPLAPSWLFQQRVEMFFKKILPCILCVEDFWYRFEWQARGSPHCHGILWCKDSPDISQINDEKMREKIQRYFDTWLVTMVFRPEEKDKTRARVQESNPCKRNPLNIEDPELDYIDLSSYVQPHLKCSSYCLKYDAEKKKWCCKFGFPQELRLRTVILEEEAKWKLYTERNDHWLNIHNVDLLRIWRGNVDLKGIIDKFAVINYLCKYCCKPEIMSKTSSELFNILLEAADDDDQPVSIIQKLLMKLAGQRDFSSQEVIHLLLHWPLWRCSRSFFPLKMYFKQTYVRVGEPEKVSVFCQYLKQYHERNMDDESQCNLSLFEYAKKYNRRNNKGKVIKRRKEAVVVVFPVLNKEPLTEEFCKQYVVLYKPHTSLEELEELGSWEEIYSSWIQTGNEPQESGLDFENNDEDDIIEPEENELHMNQDQWMVAAGMGPNSLLVNNEQLGCRNLDKMYDWKANSVLIKDIADKCGIMDINKDLIVPVSTSSNSKITCNEDQQEVLDYVENHLKSGSKTPLKIIVEGLAGTGKSFLIKSLYDLIATYDGEESIFLTGPTGTSASNINGSTLHSVIAYRPILGGGLVPLKGLAQQKFQERVRPYKWGFIDEMSMVGQELFGYVNQRLNEGKSSSEYDFAGCNMILFGDTGQLPCVRDRPLFYYPKTKKELERWPAKFKSGLHQFKKFRKRFVLKKFMRQTGISSDDQKFREVLIRLRDGRSTLDDWKFLCTRHINNLTRDEVNKFKSAPRVFTKNADCDKYNLERLVLEGKPVAKIMSDDSEDVSMYKGNLERKLLLSEGSTVMLRQNIWVKAGLVNGSIGTVEKIVYDDNGTGTMPCYILVKFPCYHGTKLFDDPKVVPIRVQTHYFVDKHGNGGRRRQFPLLLAYGLTVHKVQGLTLDQMVIDLGKSEYSAGLSYVGLSRIRSISNLIIIGNFPFTRIDGLCNKYHIKERILYEQRMTQIHNNEYVEMLDDLNIED